MEVGQLVVVSCAAPREKFFGVLIALTPAGATFRAVPLAAFDDWVRQAAAGEVPLVAPTTLFVPSHRLERIELDESSGAVEGLGDRFRRMARRDPREELLAKPAAYVPPGGTN
jgi:hypothetical protein